MGVSFFFSVEYVNGICVSDMPDSFASRLRRSTRMNYSELSFCLLTGLLEKQLASSRIHCYFTYLQVSKRQFYKSLTEGMKWNSTATLIFFFLFGSDQMNGG